MRDLQPNAPHTHLFRLIAPTLAALVVLLLSPRAGNQERRPGAGIEDVQIAQGILVEPNAGALEPPSIADENDDVDDDDGDDSGEDVPAVIEERAPVVIERRAPAREALPQDIERESPRQDELERGSGRQQELETPEGPGIKY
jgi:hypothetical protein